ncbi:hypothetical protein QCA50_005787 [Cerrena zonata]|uniref:TPR-like protein n=1 Tax=Cerrena zonata TaxID=2478898 RepID=A0AAW0GB80_9APHY
MSTEELAKPVNPEIEEKITIAKQKKDEADQAFKSGDIQKALLAYHQALLYLHGLYKDTMPAPPIDTQADAAKPKTEADEILGKIYANMAQCQIKKGNWKRAVETADKALAKSPDNPKVLFRKAKALGELGYFEKAEKILNDLLKKEDSDAASVKAELERLRVMDREREKKHNKKFKGFLNKDRGLEKEFIISPEPSTGSSIVEIS